MSLPPKTVLILGANSDVAKEMIPLYRKKGYQVIAASRNTASITNFLHNRGITDVDVRFFDAIDYASHRSFYDSLPTKPAIVVYAAGYLRNNEDALRNWEGAFQMMQVHYCGAVSML